MAIVESGKSFLMRFSRWIPVVFVAMTVLGCAARRETGVDLSTNVGAAGSKSVRDIATDEEAVST
jgi:hypothetical protein